ncbi:ClpP/crotonase [Nadsonia fulvescens var. elongata DSM 6958]|uniref:ClpP/crotonase n=1 Tax=Nadsonia fulvescens var. elongata DSM 6958 TaxID=857566 RepID=A0A1E3PQM2_9ASCO|nr:ClpP/crotonase [Nadsonia fulvescens var. elongata DSM 6958]
MQISSEKYAKFDQFLVDFPVKNVAHVQINRPKSLNSFDINTYTQFGLMMDILSYDPEVRVIVLSGVGKAFSSGLDIKTAGKILGTGDEEPSRRALRFNKFIKDFQNSIKTPHTNRKPVIGVAHGISYGLAIDILAGVDIRIASEDTSFSIKEVDIGMAADMGSLQRLPKITGNLSWIKELAYTGRNFSARESQAIGFISGISKTKEEAISHALKLADIIAKKSPVAIQTTKQSINYALDHDIQAGLDQIAEVNTYALGLDTITAVQSAFTKDKPVFSKL